MSLPPLPLTQESVLEEFEQAGALLRGHFILSSGLRSSVFLQKMFIFQDPIRTSRLCRALADKIQAQFGKIDLVVSPAIGGIVPGYETARHLGAHAIFVEREDGMFQLRRGFQIPPGARIVIVEDIMTTGLSLGETLKALRPHLVTDPARPAELVGLACLIDRSSAPLNLPLPFVSLAKLDLPTYTADALPPELARLPAIKPGSRTLPAQ